MVFKTSAITYLFSHAPLHSTHSVWPGIRLTICSHTRLKLTADKSTLHLKILTSVKRQRNPKVVGTLHCCQLLTF